MGPLGPEVGPVRVVREGLVLGSHVLVLLELASEDTPKLTW